MALRRQASTLACYFPTLLATVWGAWFFVQFQPGSLSPDSFDQYEQAITGVFNDHHPPIMALALRWLLLHQLGIGTLIGIQLALGLLGLHCLATTSAGLARPELSARSRTLAGGVVLLLFVTPASPFLFHLTTFWKDTWVLIGLLFCISALCWCLSDRLRRGSAILSMVLVLLSALLAMQARHNAVVLLAPLCVLLALHRFRASRWQAAALAALPLVLQLGSSQAIRSGFDVEARHLQNATLLADISAACKQDCSPYVRQYTSRNTPLGADFYREFDKQLFREWKAIYRASPWALVERKLRVFAKTLNLSGKPGPSYFHWQIEDFEGAVRPDGPTPPLRRDAGRETRRGLVKATSAAVRLPLLRLVLGSHAPWLAIAALGTVAYGVASWRRRALAPELALFALPLTYFLSYLPVWTSGDYRYMYPATLVCQGVVFSALVAWLLAKRPTARVT
jgi:hypothetical protein